MNTYIRYLYRNEIFTACLTQRTKRKSSNHSKAHPPIDAAVLPPVSVSYTRLIQCLISMASNLRIQFLTPMNAIPVKIKDAIPLRMLMRVLIYASMRHPFYVII